MYNYPCGMMSNKTKCRGDRSGRPVQSGMVFVGDSIGGISIESKCGIRGVIMYEVQYIVT